MINPEWLILGIGSMYTQEMHSHAPTLFDTLDETHSKPNTSATNNTPKSNSQSYPNYKEEVNVVSTPKNQPLENQNLISMEHFPSSKLVKRIIVYYDDNTFQEFESKT